MQIFSQSCQKLQLKNKYFLKFSKSVFGIFELHSVTTCGCITNIFIYFLCIFNHSLLAYVRILDQLYLENF